jgi:hypothetical protein
MKVLVRKVSADIIYEDLEVDTRGMVELRIGIGQDIYTLTQDKNKLVLRSVEGRLAILPRSSDSIMVGVV